MRAARYLACLLLTLIGRAAPAQRVVVYRAAEQSWTLTSGPVTYRLAKRGDELALDYFGPTSKLVAWSRDTTAPRRYDLTGVADGHPFAPPLLRLVAQQTRTVAPGVEELRLTLRRADLPLEVEARYRAWGETGVLTRDLTLTNRGTTPIAVEAVPSIGWDLPKGDYTLRYLWGGWGQERQLAAERLGAGARRFDQTLGRSSNGYAPWLSLRNESSGVEYLAELAWSGNWWMQVARQPGQCCGLLGDRDVSVQIGLRNDFGQALTLAPGATFDLPRVAFTASRGDLDDAANQMHRYQRQYVFPRSQANRPLLVQYNSWYPYRDSVSIDRMKQAADDAAAIGAEAYVLDSGWYSSSDWASELGDYQVNRAKFPGGLEELATYVHGKGMKFGLWTEIENVSQGSRVFREHRDWCLPYRGEPVIAAGRCQLDFAKPEVRQWARATVDRLVRTYRLDWIKIDYNIDIGDRFDPADADGRADGNAGNDAGGRRLHDHLVSYYRWLDELRAAYPNLVVENCASGGLRFDTGIMAHAHTTWISDNVDPVASLQLGYGCTVQFAPEVCNHWMVGDTEFGEVDPTKPPGWWDFMFRVPMTGQFGISGHVASWSQPVVERASANVALYKRIRATLLGADVYHLTPPPAPARPTGWMALQYVAPDGARSVVMAYRLAGGAAEQAFRLRGLAPRTVYDVSQDGRPLTRATGAQLAADGLRVALDGEWRAVVIEIVARP